MNELLQKVFDAHGGLERWNTFSWVRATIVSGGQLWAMKKVPQDPTPREMRVATKQWASVAPYGAPDQHTEFTVERVAIERIDGTVVSERFRPSEHAEGKALDRAYFNGYALWTYLTTPFLFALPGFAVEGIEPWREQGELWRGLRVSFPPEIASHSKKQDFHFGPDFCCVGTTIT